METMDKLFDILICRCPFVDCNQEKCDIIPFDTPHINCDCLRVYKIPVIELPFIKDQRSKCGLNGGEDGDERGGPEDSPAAGEHHEEEGGCGQAAG